MSAVKSSSVLAGSSLIVMLCHTSTIHLYARRFSEQALAEYLVALSAAVLMAPFFSLGINDSVLYYIGRERDHRSRCLQILLTALSCFLATGSLALLAILAFPDLFSRLFFSRSGHGTLVLVTACLTLARFSYDCFFRYLTATRHVLLPGIVQSSVMGLLPLAIILIGRPLDIRWLLAETAAGTFLLWLAFFAFVQFRSKPVEGSVRPSMQTFHELFIYGVQRIPTLLGLTLMLSAPVVLAKHLQYEAGQVVVIGASLSLLRMLGVTNQLMTYIMLPRISWARRHAPQLLGRTMGMLMGLALALGWVVLSGFLGTGDTVLALWLDRPRAGIDAVSLQLWLAALPCILVSFLRPTIDGLHVRAYNTPNILVAVAAMFLIITGLHYGLNAPNAISWGYLTGMTLLAALSYRSVLTLTPGMHLPRLEHFSARSLGFMGGALILLGLALLLRRQLVDAGLTGIVLGIVLMGVMAAAFMALVLQQIQRDWNRLSRKNEEEEATAPS